jgi:copper chaperone CopZ
LVRLALERSEGVTDFKLGLASATVKFDTEKIDEETIIKNVKKMTRYDTVTVKEEMSEEMMKEE